MRDNLSYLHTLLGETSYPIKDKQVIFGMEIDNNLDFSGHISKCAKRLIINLTL